MSIDQWFEFDAPVAEAERHRYRDALKENATEEQLAALQSAMSGEVLAQWQTVITGSPFAAAWLTREPEWLIALCSKDALVSEQWPASNPFPTDFELDSQAFDRQLRRVRNRAQAAVIWQDLNRLWSTEQVIATLSQLADYALDTTLAYHYHHLCEEMGTPHDEQGRAQPMIILGLGKLGAWELNLSSDIDLMFAYPDKGETRGGKKPQSNQEFFTRLGQRIIKSLDAATQDGFVFRVDMRLRPYGNSGALVSSFDALEDYYQTQGREWERFAMIKARIVASNATRAEHGNLMGILNSFTYRRYVDFSAIEALRNLKVLINREVARRRLNDNIKLGRGGIREVEFIAQAFQIIRGGRDTELQERRLLRILPLLDKLHCLPEGVASQLCEAYIFLRNVEHAIQAYNDEQTQNLPRDESARERLASVLGYPGVEPFLAALDDKRKFISTQFQAVIADPEHEGGEVTSAEDETLAAWAGVWQAVTTPGHDAASLLSQQGVEQAEELAQMLDEFVQGPRVKAMDAAGSGRLDQFMPRLFAGLVRQEDPVTTLKRVLGLLNAIVRRSAYLVLLTENPGALNQLLALVAASPWIAGELTAHPALLDELLDPSTLYHVPSKTDLAEELRQYLLRIAADDLEQQMDALRYFRSAHALRVAACEITGRLPLMRVSDYLTELAEVILDYVLHLAWQQMVARHGYPDGKTREGPDFIIVGYGKLGGIELGHGSDLDLVFIHDADPQGETGGDADGKRVIDNNTFYVRMGQKIIHILNTQTVSGQLYEVDMRLRPSGASGLLVTSYNAFEKYQRQDAWTWEHQALVRARAIAGDAVLVAKFDAIRQEILQQSRDTEALKNSVVDMRQKMRSQLGSRPQDQAAGRFAIKQDAGGIVDIEFMVQYAVLAWSHAIPALAHYTDNIRILGCLEDSGQLQTQEVNQLIEAYKAFRSIGHRLALQQQSAIIESSPVETERNHVIAVWQRLMG